jgi:hypothetical protein
MSERIPNFFELTRADVAQNEVERATLAHLRGMDHNVTVCPPCAYMAADTSLADRAYDRGRQDGFVAGMRSTTTPALHVIRL